MLGHLLVESSGKVTLTKKGQRAYYNVVGADDQGNILLGLNPNVTEGFFKVRIAKNAAIRHIKPTKKGGDDSTALLDVLGHLLVESTGIATVQVDSWPPPAADRLDKSSPKIAHATLIIKTLDAHVRSGNVKIKKPPISPEQRAERTRLLLEAGGSFIRPDKPSEPEDRPPTRREP